MNGPVRPWRPTAALLLFLLAAPLGAPSSGDCDPVPVEPLCDPADCDDGVLATTDACDPALGCVHEVCTAAVVVGRPLGLPTPLGVDEDQALPWLESLGFDTRLLHTADGLTFAALADACLVVYLNGGYDWSRTPRPQEAVAALTEARDAGVALYLSGDDLAYRADTVAGVSELTHFAAAASNGTATTVTFVARTHPIVDGPFGVVADFHDSSDVDPTRALSPADVVVAVRGDGEAGDVILTYDHASGARVVSQLTHLVTSADPAAVETLFRNTVAWLRAPVDAVRAIGR